MAPEPTGVQAPGGRAAVECWQCKGAPLTPLAMPGAPKPADSPAYAWLCLSLVGQVVPATGGAEPVPSAFW